VSPRSLARASSSVAAGLSLLCAAHCVALPLAIAALPLAGLERLAGGATEDVLALVSFTAATVGLAWGVRAHGRRLVLGGLVLGALLLLSARATESETAERIVAFTGSLVLAASLWWNHRSCAHCDHREEETDGGGST
jgi:hypothetical protein